MAVAQMAKVVIVSHRTQASELLEALQREGICQILNAHEAMVSKDLPEGAARVEKPRDTQHLLEHLEESIAFLKNYAESRKGIAAIFSPRTVISEEAYRKVVSSREAAEVIEQSRRCESAIERFEAERENIFGTLDQLWPWESLETPVEEIGQLQQVTALPILIPVKQIEQLELQLIELGAAIEVFGMSGSRCACLIACLNQNLSDLQKLLRSFDFEVVAFGDMAGTAAELIKQNRENLEEIERRLKAERDKAISLSKDLLKLEILYDHYVNLSNREQTRGAVPVTEHTVLLEGWVKENDFRHLEEIVSRFGASSLVRIAPAEGEEIPVEIENKSIVRPFEVITRLYGMPKYLEVDPTICLAPFFALFFGVCVGDVGYGLSMLILSIWAVKKMQGDKKLLLMLIICSIFAIIFGALTGGWFGDALQQFEFLAFLRPLKDRLMWFDPFGQPMLFFGLSIALGYIQIMTGLIIAFVGNLLRKNFIAAICDQLTWLVMLNSIVTFAFGKAGVIPATIGKVAGFAAIVPAVMIFLFSQREGGLGSRLGMGFYNLFSSVFYVGDLLSYLRLMGLSMVGTGLAMAVNLMGKQALGIRYGVGVVLMIIILVIGHSFNLLLSALGAFVHTLRLQYVEYFPKFFTGGGKAFEPLSKKYKYIYIPGA
jgi:V/A-type H+-transporting ATPase subunit I